MIIRKLEALFTINTNTAQFQKAASQLDNLASKAQTMMNALAGYWAVQALQNFVLNTSNAEDRKNEPLLFFLPLYTGKHLLQKVHISPLMGQLLLVNPEVKVAWGLVVRKPRGRRLIFYEFLHY